MALLLYIQLYRIYFAKWEEVVFSYLYFRSASFLDPFVVVTTWPTVGRLLLLKLLSNMLRNVHISGIFRNRSLYFGFFVNFIYSNQLLFTDNSFLNILPEN